MTKIDELFDPRALDQALSDGHVREQTHPYLPYKIYNYSDEASHGGIWTDVTRQCRGLIVNSNTGEVLARPFEKFHNWGDRHAYAGRKPDLTLRGRARTLIRQLLRRPEGPERVVVTDKMDGSLGIVYPTPTGHAVATRGAFMSEQAIHATAVWEDRYEDAVSVDPRWTLMLEIIYPFNRIVVDYHGMDDLVVLGAVNINTGDTLSPGDAAALVGWAGPVAREFPYASLADALAATPRPNAEGYVVHFPDAGERIKLKQADYVALHRILTGVTARTLWEFLAVNACVDGVEIGPQESDPVGFLVRKLQLAPNRIKEILAVGPDWQDIYMQGVPEEFRVWVVDRIGTLNRAAAEQRRVIADAFTQLQATATDAHRSGLVTAARQITEHWRIVLLQMDGRQIETWVWTQVRPGHERPFRSDDV